MNVKNGLSAMHRQTDVHPERQTDVKTEDRYTDVKTELRNPKEL